VPAWAVRERLTAGRLQAGTALARFVRAEYEQFGHPVERDLFSEEEEIWLDRRLAVELAEDLLAREAERLRAEGWGWVEAGITRPQDCWRFTRLEPEEGEGWSAAQRAQGGCIVTIGADGGLAVEQGLMRPEDRPTPETGEPTPTPSDPDPAVSEPEPAGSVLSASLRRDLEAVRTRVFQACLASDPAWAQAVLIERLAGALFGAEAGFTEPVCRVMPEREAGDGRPEAACPKAEAHLAGLEARFRPLMAGTPLDRLKAIAALDADDRAQLLALCVALTCRAPFADGPDERVEHVGAALGIDLADWWRPGEEGFWARVTKRVMAGVLAEAGVDQIPVATMRKPDAVRLLADLTSEAESERARAWPKARARLRRWLPDGLAFGRPGREEEDGPEPDPDPLPAAAPVPDDEEEPEDELPAAA
jgi:ParB family transcriptional regulator, chromosome partitioning protein